MQNGCIILIQEARCNKKLTDMNEKFCFFVAKHRCDFQSYLCDRWCSVLMVTGAGAEVAEPHSVACKGLPSGGLPPLVSPPKLRGILPLKPLGSG